MSTLQLRRSPLDVILALREAKKLGNGVPLDQGFRESLAEALEPRQLLTVTAANLSPPTSATEGNVAYFYPSASTDHDPATTTWTIRFGDGTSLVTTVNGSASIGHTYAAAGSYTASATVTDTSTGGTYYSCFTSASVADGVISGSLTSITATEGAAFSGVIAHFTDTSPNKTVADFTANAVFGDDGTISYSESVVADGGGFDVVATHTFTAAATYAGTVSIHDNETASATTSLSSTVHPPTLSVSSTADAQENGADGTLHFSLADGSGNPLDAVANTTVSYTASGTAVAGTNYTAIGTVTIPAGHSSVDVPVAALEDNTIDPTLTVIVTLSSGGSAYTVGTSSATCDILDGDTRTIAAGTSLFSPGESETVDIAVSGYFSSLGDALTASCDSAVATVSSVVVDSITSTEELAHVVLTGVAVGTTDLDVTDVCANNAIPKAVDDEPYSLSINYGTLSVCTAGPGKSLVVTATSATGLPASIPLSVQVDATPSGVVAFDATLRTTDANAKATFQVTGKDDTQIEGAYLTFSITGPHGTGSSAVNATVYAVAPIINVSTTTITLGAANVDKTVTATVLDPTSDDAPIQGVQLVADINGTPDVAAIDGAIATTGADGTTVISAVPYLTDSVVPPSGSSTTMILSQASGPADAESSTITLTEG